MFPLQQLLALVAPHECLECGNEGAVLCAVCAPVVCPPAESCCYLCGAGTKRFAPCPNCTSISPLRQVWVATPYDGRAKDVLHLFKFERAQAAAQPIARLMTQRLPKLPRNLLIVPVPTATSRVRQRGYDHTLLLARALARQTGLHSCAALRRVGQRRQVGASRQQRLGQLTEAFYVREPRRVQNKRILLIDDVVTTGASLRVAAACLLQAGAKSVTGACFAYKQSASR